MQSDTMTVEQVVRWAETEGIALGANPRRTLVHLAGQGIIPKSVKGPNCKGVYDRRIILDRLRFYHDRRRAHWRLRDIRQAVTLLRQTGADVAPDPARVAQELEHRGTQALMALPLETTFRHLFNQFMEHHPAAASDVIRFFDEQDSLTGTPIGTAFRQLIGQTHPGVPKDQVRLHFAGHGEFEPTTPHP